MSSIARIFYFYPRPPRGGRLTSLLTQSTSSRFLSTPSARRATCKYPSARVVTCISIHALREEGDKPRKVHDREPLYFYPRPPRGGRLHCVHGEHAAVKFLSTPSARRATPDGLPLDFDRIDFYPRPPRGGRHSSPPMIFTSTMDFYPRPPRGGRPCEKAWGLSIKEFLSTPSARRATAKTETKSLFSNKLYNILHEFRRALIYNGSKNYPNHAKRLENPVRRCRKDAEDSPFAPGRKTQNNSRPSCSKGG